ncbi:MAG: HAD family hydrolase [Bdellovibrionales bacterium]|nr:HAD family hydrolase [Bdellovibrionales bacterium]
MSAPSFQQITIDLDGTLVQFREIPAGTEFILRSVRKFSRDPKSDNPSWIRSLKGLRDIKNELKRPSIFSEYPEATNMERSAIVFAERLEIPVEEAKTVLLRVMREVFPKISRYFAPIPGAPEFIQWAKGKLPLTLATNPVWPKDLVEHRVRWAAVDPASFQFITHAENMHATKPTGHYYRELLKHISALAPLNSPADCLHIGNELIMDLPATRVGIPTFIIQPGVPFQKIQNARGELAPAWTGSFKDLQNFIQEGLSKS